MGHTPKISNGEESIMLPAQSCPWYITSLGSIVPPIALIGVIAIPMLAVGGQRFVAAIGNPNASLIVAQIRNITLGIALVATVLAVAIVGWLMMTYPSECYQWFP